MQPRAARHTDGGGGDEDDDDYDDDDDGADDDGDGGNTRTKCIHPPGGGNADTHHTPSRFTQTSTLNPIYDHPTPFSPPLIECRARLRVRERARAFQYIALSSQSTARTPPRRQLPNFLSRALTLLQPLSSSHSQAPALDELYCSLPIFQHLPRALLLCLASSLTAE
jgi:hypothetical protein